MTKISDLTALSGSAVDDAADLLTIVDMSETGAARNKKITIDETRIALGLSSADSPQFTAINLGHASDTTITRASAGVVAIEGVNIVTTAGGVTFAADISVPDEAYDATNWDGNLEVPTKNAVRDKIESLSAGGAIEALDEGVSLTATMASIDFVGAGVTATNTGGDVTVTIPGGGASALDDLSDVNTAGQTSGDVLTYDGAGWVPQAPTAFSGCMVHKAADETTANYSAGATVAWDTEDYDTDSYHPLAATVTITIATPGVVTWTGHTFIAGTPIVLSTTGALPTGLTAGTTYYVVSPAADTFQLSATRGGAAINTSGTQSGTHTGTNYSSLVIPADGYYVVTYNFETSSDTADDYIRAMVLKNGSTGWVGKAMQYSYGSAAGHGITASTPAVFFVAGDRVESWLDTEADTSITVKSDSSSFAILRVG